MAIEKYKQEATAVAVIADRTAYDVRCSYRPLAGMARGQHEYLLICSFKLKSAFDAGSVTFIPVSFLAVCCVLWLNDTYYSKVSKEVK